MNPPSESERKTRKARIDPKLDASGWKLRPKNEIPFNQPHRTEEEETSAGPALCSMAGSQDRGLGGG